jgi:hypothetical protein
VTAQETARPETFTLHEILRIDPRSSPSACAHVDYGDAVVSDRPLSTLSPPNGDGETRVEVFLFVQAIDRIDPAANSFRFQGYGGMIWCDPRLSFDASEEGSDRRSFPAKAMLQDGGEIWWPGLILPTQLGEPEITNDRVIVFSDGTVEFQTKVNTRLTARYDFRLFPLDRQTLRIVLDTYPWRADGGRVLLTESTNRMGFDRRFEMAEWELGKVDSGIGPAADPKFWMEIHVARRSGFYLWKIILPLVIIVCVAWSTFWLTRDALAQRQRQVATAVLTLVAFQFTAVGDLPRVPYLTIMDRVMLWSYIAVGATFISNVLSARLYRKHSDLGLAFDRRGRWLYPLFYGTGFVAIVVRYHLLS